MKMLLDAKYLPFRVLALGAAGFVLRKNLYSLALDGKKLLQSHPLEWLLGLVTVLVLAMALLASRKETASGSGRVRAIGSLVLALGIGATVLLKEPAASGILGTAWKVLGVLSFASLDVAAKQQWEGKRPFFLLYAIVCVFFAVHMVSCYQGWSSNPQIQDYLFSLLAGVAMMLFAYQKSALAVDCGSRRWMTALGAFGAYAGMVALSGTVFPLLYLTGSVWLLTGLWGE